MNTCRNKLKDLLEEIYNMDNRNLDSEVAAGLPHSFSHEFEEKMQRLIMGLEHPKESKNTLP